MARWQRLAETNPSASPEQQVLMGLMVVAELENFASPGCANPKLGPDSPASPTPTASDIIS